MSDGLGPCPLCGRPLIAGPSVDEHHWVPKTEGGRQTSFVHRVCHRALHARFTERELAQNYATPEAVRADPDMAKSGRRNTWIGPGTCVGADFTRRLVYTGVTLQPRGGRS
jgi:hypothetical protein